MLSSHFPNLLCLHQHQLPPLYNNTLHDCHHGNVTCFMESNFSRQSRQSHSFSNLPALIKHRYISVEMGLLRCFEARSGVFVALTLGRNCSLYLDWHLDFVRLLFGQKIMVYFLCCNLSSAFASISVYLFRVPSGYIPIPKCSSDDVQALRMELRFSLYHYVRCFPSPPICQQDQQVPINTLSLPTQLNVKADLLASQFVYSPEISSTHAPMITGATALLHGPHGTINSNYRQALRRLASDPHMIHHLCSRNEWSSATFDTISWDSLASALCGQFSCRQFFMKYLHDWLPLGDKRSLYADHYPFTCPKCTPPVLETREHFLRCPCRKWVGSLLEDLTTFWKTHFVDPTLQSILQELLLSWIAAVPPRLDHLSAPYAVLLAQQSTVGILHLFYGRFVTDRSVLQDHYLSRCPPSERCDWGGYLCSSVVRKEKNCLVFFPVAPAG